MKENTKKTKSEKIRHLFTSNWLSKFVSLLIAMGVWFTIFSHLQKTKAGNNTPVPGTIPIPKSPEPPKPTIPPLLSPPPVIPGN